MAKILRDSYTKSYMWLPLYSNLFSAHTKQGKAIFSLKCIVNNFIQSRTKEKDKTGGGRYKLETFRVVIHVGLLSSVMLCVQYEHSPLAGAIPKNDGEANPLASMTEEEKEEEAEKLAGLIRELSGLGIIKPLQVGSDGRLQECASLMQKDTDNDDSTN